MMSSLRNWLRPRHGTVVNRNAGRKATNKLHVETLEDRCVPSTVQGHVFNDVNGNGVFDSGESGLAGWTVYLDGPQALPWVPPNNVLDPGEPFLVTDANGAYSFTDLNTPVYVVSRVLQVNDPAQAPGRWLDTTGSTLHNYLPTSGTVSGVDFGVRYQPFVGVAPAGPETLVNQTTAGQQGQGGTSPGYAPTSVSAAPDGHYVVAWRTYVIGGTDTIYARVFNPDGSPHTDAINVASFQNDSVPNVSMDIEMPKVAMAGNGNFVIEWHYSSLNIYSLDGNVLSGPITAAGGVQGLAADATGNFVVLYSGATKNGLTPLYAQRYTPTGTANGSAIKVASPSLANGLQGVAMASAGNFVVVWDDLTTSRNNGGSHVFAQQFTAAGRTSGSQITVASGNGSPDGWTLWPKVAMNASGRFVVAYQAGGQRQARVYNANGTPTTTNPVNFSDPLDHVSGVNSVAQVAMDVDGNVVFVWTAALNGGYTWEGEARMQRLLASGTLEPFTIVNTTTQGPQSNPGVAATGSGTCVVAWQGYGPSDDAGIFAQRFAPLPYVAPSATPQIGSFTADPNPATAGSPVTLTVSNITDANPNSTITQVAFYEDTNGDGVPDVLLGYGAQTGPGVWTFSFTFSSGTHKLLAQALDSYGVLSDPLEFDLQVN